MKDRPDRRLAALIDGLQALDSQREHWPDGTVLDIRCYVTDREPPLALVSGVRALLRKGDAILAFDEPGGTRIVPGGTLEPGEAPLNALRREVREECGCELMGEPRQIGVLWFHHVTPWREGYRYPYPDFLQILYIAETSDEPREGAEEPLVLRPRFVSRKELAGLRIPPAERALLRVL